MSIRREELFCYLCGSKLAPHPTGRYDVYTGEPLFRKVCINTKCENGCLNMGGHIGKIFSSRCARCGVIISSWE